MQTHIKYGHQGLNLEFPETPNFIGVLYPQDAEVLAEPAEAVFRSLTQPIASRSLKELAQGKADALIVISDITRPVPNALLLPIIIQQLKAAGIPAAKITILIATGIHRPNEGEELERLVGKEIATSCRIINHFSKNTDEMLLVGHIGDGVPALVNKHYLAADLKILTGFIEPHMWAGFSGGRKSILPGISSVKTLEFMHGPEMVAHPQTRYGVLQGNPFHEAGLAIMAQAGADFIVNVTLDTDKKVTGIFSGHPVKAHLAGVEFLSRHCVRTLDAPLDFVVTTNAGAPLDCNLYQTAKGISGVAGATREGGVILIASECPEGFGSEEYRAVFELVTTPQAFIDKLMKKEFFIPDQWCAQETYQVMLKNEIWVHTKGIDDETLKRFHFRPVADINQAISELLERFGQDARWAIVPDGPLLILKVD
ncbi:nickel-dependent lactate racemase [Geopsychrobacter electrodiphilus]|uniref:nickel-dependent lactate racemase n=1 Tax=Geopsychrobacter electrodiphilus TaxID=225196 RepID=UPI00037198D0|nr:nickel-dependent lactate racemase [Geopsychrobacter electrodiphilus]